MAGSADNGLPGVGTFAYSGLSTLASGPQAVVVATRSYSAKLTRHAKKVAGKAIMHLRISAAAVVSSIILAGSAQAQVEQAKVGQIEVQQARIHQVQFLSWQKLPDSRGEFVRLCAPHMVGRWAHPESVCGCLHDYAAATVEDADLREALLRGISETGVPTIETAWVPPSKQSEIGPTFTKIAKTTLQCMFEPAK